MSSPPVAVTAGRILPSSRYRHPGDVRSSLASLLRGARSPVRLALLFGGSALITLAYIAGLVASVAAFGSTAGLTGIGIPSGPAVSAVLLYRLATYWLPVPPGWYSWRLLQRMDYV